MNWQEYPTLKNGLSNYLKLKLSKYQIAFQKYNLLMIYNHTNRI